MLLSSPGKAKGTACVPRTEMKRIAAGEKCILGKADGSFEIKQKRIKCSESEAVAKKGTYVQRRFD